MSEQHLVAAVGAGFHDGRIDLAEVQERFGITDHRTTMATTNTVRQEHCENKDDSVLSFVPRTTHEDFMPNPFDAMWTILREDEGLDLAFNQHSVVDGAQAWDTSMPHVIGACGTHADGFDVAIVTMDANRQVWTVTVNAHSAIDARSIAGTITTSSPGDAEFGDPCLLLRGIDLHAVPPTIKQMVS